MDSFRPLSDIASLKATRVFLRSRIRLSFGGPLLSNEKLEHSERFRLRDVLLDGERGTGTGRESDMGSWGSRHVDIFRAGDFLPAVEFCL